MFHRQIQNAAFFFAIVALIGCPDPEEGPIAPDAGTSEMRCTIDEQCFNGQYCNDGICVPNEQNNVIMDAGTQTPSSDVIDIQFTAPDDRSTAFKWEAVSIGGAVSDGWRHHGFKSDAVLVH